MKSGGFFVVLWGPPNAGERSTKRSLNKMQIYNTLTQEKAPFTTITPGEARLYVCGPTVYDYSHIGHARCYVVYDVLVRHLRANGLDVTFTRGVTDVDDKIINRAAKNQEDPLQLAERFLQAYHEDMARLGNLEPDIEPKVSDHIDQIVALVQRLIDNGSAYAVDGDVYFHVPNFADYGKLSHRNLDDMLAGASDRTASDETARKKHPFDFALWKGGDGSVKTWNSPWGPGRPGWHIECSAMSMHHLGESFDLHGGGLDLVFPHHENEIAQSEAATCKCYAHTWMHNGFVQVNKEKMGKSLGNFFLLREVFRRAEPEALRYALMTMHYRGPFNLEWDNDEGGNLQGFPQFEEAEKRLEYVYTTRQRLEAIPKKRIVELADAKLPPDIMEYEARLKSSLDDDLNTPVALAHTSELLSAINQLCDQAMAKKGKVAEVAVAAAHAGFRALSARLGLGADQPSAFLNRVRDRRAEAIGVDRDWVERMLLQRRQAREAKDFARADEIRDELGDRGVEVLDGQADTSWRLHATRNT